ncbi:hypothetical protein [Burkholderia gladioli]|uniref:hypothetical protein n=1 Tax=Burkholderia gladioli TaxID=28095 RepID=UPI0016413D00|nr:hypothetical protein [Burkholderia gladioli]
MSKESERSEFEAWRKTLMARPNLMRIGDYYEDYDTQIAWSGFQAARASQAAAPAEAREPDAYLVTDGRLYRSRAFLDKGEAEKSVAQRNDGSRIEPLYRGSVPADAGEAVAWICSGSHDFAPIVRDRAAALKLSQEHGDGKIVALGIVPDVVSQGAQGGKGGEA